MDNIHSQGAPRFDPNQQHNGNMKPKDSDSVAAKSSRFGQVTTVPRLSPYIQHIQRAGGVQVLPTSGKPILQRQVAIRRPHTPTLGSPVLTGKQSNKSIERTAQGTQGSQASVGPVKKSTQGLVAESKMERAPLPDKAPIYANVPDKEEPTYVNLQQLTVNGGEQIHKETSALTQQDYTRLNELAKKGEDFPPVKKYKESLDKSKKKRRNLFAALLTKKSAEVEKLELKQQKLAPLIKAFDRSNNKLKELTQGMGTSDKKTLADELFKNTCLKMEIEKIDTMDESTQLSNDRVMTELMRDISLSYFESMGYVFALQLESVQPPMTKTDFENKFVKQPSVEKRRPHLLNEQVATDVNNNSEMSTDVFTGALRACVTRMQALRKISPQVETLLKQKVGSYVFSQHGTPASKGSIVPSEHMYSARDFSQFQAIVINELLPEVRSLCEKYKIPESCR